MCIYPESMGKPGLNAKPGMHTNPGFKSKPGLPTKPSLLIKPGLPAEPGVQYLSPMLPESRILTCIDNDAGYAVHFFEGQKLIRDLALLHDFSPAGFSWFRDCVLSVQPMVSLLKQGEGFGFFLDSEEPRFKLNFETGFHGQMRAMLTPRAFAHPPGEVHGTGPEVDTRFTASSRAMIWARVVLPRPGGP